MMNNKRKKNEGGKTALLNVFDAIFWLEIHDEFFIYFNRPNSNLKNASQTHSFRQFSLLRHFKASLFMRRSKGNFNIPHSHW